MPPWIVLSCCLSFIPFLRLPCKSIEAKASRNTPCEAARVPHLSSPSHPTQRRTESVPSRKQWVRAPPGYAIVGADVDGKELWISSCMGDAQFGMHGATPLGWMTLEGTKAAGTDLHSKTAKILGLSRDQAKVFTCSRICGAGMKHAILQANAGMSVEEAHKLDSEQPKTPLLGCGVTYVLSTSLTSLDRIT